MENFIICTITSKPSKTKMKIVRSFELTRYEGEAMKIKTRYLLLVGAILGIAASLFKSYGDVLRDYPLVLLGLFLIITVLACRASDRMFFSNGAGSSQNKKLG